MPEQFAHPIAVGRGRMRPPGRCQRPHGLDAWVLWLTTAGRCEIVHRRGRTLNGRGEAVLIRPGVAQDYGCPAGDGASWDCLWVVFQPRPHWMGLLDWPPLGPGHSSLALSGTARHHLRQHLRRCLAVATGGGHRIEERAMLALEQALLVADEQNPHTPSPDARVQSAIDHARGHLHRGLAVADLAAAVGLSAVQLNRLFRRELGTSVQQQIEAMRMRRAAELLRFTALPVAEVAAEVGYDDPFYFSTRFRRHHGLAPRTFRQRH